MDSVLTVIILGSLWGIYEATVGYVLHTFSLSFGSYLWFPIAFYFINKAYQSTKSYKCVFLTALLTSSIKLLNLLLPGRIDMVINPAVSILLEAIAFLLVIHFIDFNKLRKFNFYHILLMGFTWRAFYLSYVLLLPESLIMISPAADIIKFTRFMFLYNIGNCVLIYGCYVLWVRFVKINVFYDRLAGVFGRYRILKPTFSGLVLLTAIVIQFVVK